MSLLLLHRIALTLKPLRSACLLLALGGGIGIVLGVMDTGSTDSVLLRMSLLFTLWMLMLHAYIQLFQTIPSPVLPGLPWWDRCKQQMGLWAYRGLAAAVLLVGLALLSLSLKLLFL